MITQHKVLHKAISATYGYLNQELVMFNREKLVCKMFQVIYMNDDLYLSLMDQDGSTSADIQFEAKTCLEEVRKMEKECEETDDFFLCVNIDTFHLFIHCIFIALF